MRSTHFRAASGRRSSLHGWEERWGPADMRPPSRCGMKTRHRIGSGSEQTLARGRKRIPASRRMPHRSQRTMGRIWPDQNNAPEAGWSGYAARALEIEASRALEADVEEADFGLARHEGETGTSLRARFRVRGGRRCSNVEITKRHRPSTAYSSDAQCVHLA